MDFKVKDRRPARDAIVYEEDRTVEFTFSHNPWWLSLPVIEEITDEDYRRTPVEKTKTVALPDFLFMFTTENQKLLKKLIKFFNLLGNSYNKQIS